MKYSIAIQTFVNDQPEHVFVQHKGVAEGKVERLFLEVVQEQYERLERGKPIEYLIDAHPAPYAVVMSRLFEYGAVTTVTVIAGLASEIQAYVDALEAKQSGRYYVQPNGGEFLH